MASYWFKKEVDGKMVAMGLITNVGTMQQLFMRIDGFTDPYSVKIKEENGVGMYWSTEYEEDDDGGVYGHNNIQYDDEYYVIDSKGWKIPPWARKNAKEMTYADDSVYNKCID